MSRITRVALALTASCWLLPATGRATDEGDGPPASLPDAVEALRRLTATRPHAAVSTREGRITRIYGGPLAEGADAGRSAERFRALHAAVFGVTPEALVAVGPPAGQPVMHDPATGAERFTAFRYDQRCGSLEVFAARLVLLVRNEPGQPVVLASSALRDLGGFRPPALPEIDDRRALELARSGLGPSATVREHDLVVFAGAGDRAVAPSIACRAVIADDEGRWLTILDPETGAVLHRESLICFAGADGVVSGLTTQGAASEQCGEQRPAVVPYARVRTEHEIRYTDPRGAFELINPIRPPFPVTVDLRGLWFRVRDFAGADLAVTSVADGPGPVELLLNAQNTETVRAQVTAYVAANEVRDFVIRHNPAFPGLYQPLPIVVNRTDSVCPGNAWYDFGDQSLNFCRAGEEHPNTAWPSVVYHEYGHHLVQMSPSGQGPYGEGIGDAMSLLMLDDPRLAVGYWGPCDEPLRTADNDCQFHPVGCSTCGISIHSCAQLLSGCIWSLRNELLAVDPAGGLDTLAALVINSILVHTGATITDDIAIDFLTLDDDNANILDGTPHYHPIANAFGAHGLDAPFVPLIAFDFPDGLPETLPPTEELLLTVEVRELSGNAVPGTGTLHVSPTGLPGTFLPVPMEEVAPEVYEARFAPMDCWATVYYYFAAEAEIGFITPVHTFPTDAPRRVLSVMVADAALPGFVDDAEADLGWTVVDSETLEAGSWERGIPVGPGNRGDPTTDGDGSGQCFLTENDPEDPNSDVDEGATTLVSPVLDATQDGDAAFVSYYRWFTNNKGGGPYQDPFLVEVSDDGGATWTVLETVGPGGPEIGAGWRFKRFRIDEHVEPTERFRIRFTASDTDPQSVVEAGVDGLEVRRYACDGTGAACLADVSGDGWVGVDDLMMVLGAWGGDGGPPDVDGDGAVDAQDLLLVLVAWGACPVPGG
jgi:hypothetical protein